MTSCFGGYAEISYDFGCMNPNSGRGLNPLRTAKPDALETFMMSEPNGHILKAYFPGCR